MDYTGRSALITGASAGIGAAFARSLAGKGANIVLTARREDRLHQLADELKKKYSVKVDVISGDFNLPDTPERIFRQLERQGIEVDILINNAGIGLPGQFLDYEWAKHRDFLELMVTSYAHMTRLFLPGMVKRGFGRQILVSSVAGLVPGSAGHTMYGASKAFLVSFAESLAAECAGKGVHVSALCPGFTYTEFHDVSGTRELVSKLPKLLFMDPEPVVEGAIRAVEKEKTVYVPGFVNKFLVAFLKLLPRSLSEALLRRNSKRFRAQHREGG